MILQGQLVSCKPAARRSSTIATILCYEVLPTCCNTPLCCKADRLVFSMPQKPDRRFAKPHDATKSDAQCCKVVPFFFWVLQKPNCRVSKPRDDARRLMCRPALNIASPACDIAMLAVIAMKL